MYAHAQLNHTTQRVKYTWDDSVSGYTSKLQFYNEVKSLSEHEKCVTISQQIMAFSR
jgi:hypothetical protein